MESINHKLDRVRKPRVHIKYEVETEDGVATRELPFVVGVMGDFTGHADKKPFRERQFIEIDRDNFDTVMAKMQPSLSLKVDNTLSEADEHLKVDLNFKSLADFTPEHLVRQVPALNRLLQLRNHLRDLLSQADRCPEVEALIKKALTDPNALSELASLLEPSIEKGV
jgi:type VI secretion system protein ImpB